MSEPLTTDHTGLIQNAQEAAFLKSKLDPYFALIERRALNELKGGYRAEKLSAQQLQISVGLLCAVDDLKNILTREINVGRHLESQMTEINKPKGGFDPYD